MKQLSPLHASRSYRPSGLHDPKAAHHSWSFAGLPGDSHRLCFRFHGLIHDPPDFCLTTACSLRHKLIVQDFQHASSLNPVKRGLSTRVSMMLCCFRSTDETVSSAFAFHRLAPADPTADNRLEPLRLSPLSAPRDLIIGRRPPFLAGLTLFPMSDRTLLPAPLLACANCGFR